MKESPIKTERKTLHLPEDTVRALNKLAAKNGTDFSKEVRRAIDEYLDLETTAENIDMINGVIRQELSGQLKALGNRLAGLINRLTIISAAGYYLTNEPDKAYQFIIYDCGVMQTPTSIFRDADHRLLCGSVLPYEIPVFHKALSECGSLEVRPVAICVPQEIQEYCMELFGENVQIAAASHDLFAKRVNGQIYRPLVEKYIAGEKRL